MNLIASRRTGKGCRDRETQPRFWGENKVPAQRLDPLLHSGQAEAEADRFIDLPTIIRNLDVDMF